MPLSTNFQSDLFGPRDWEVQTLGSGWTLQVKRCILLYEGHSLSLLVYLSVKMHSVKQTLLCIFVLTLDRATEYGQ